MAAKNSNKNRNSKKSASVIKRSDTGPLAAGRAVRRLINNGDGYGLAKLIGGIWAQFDARLGGSLDIRWDGKNQAAITSEAVSREVDKLLFSISFHEPRISDDETYGEFACNLIMKSACEHIGILYVECEI